MPVETKFYDLLQVPPDASAADIKRAFKRLALKHHPDRGGDTKRFQDISAAHEVLIDDEKRRIYNDYGEDGLRQAAQGNDPRAAGTGAVPADLFGSLFKEFGGFFNGDGLFGSARGDSPNSRGRARQTRPRKHEAVMFRTSVTLEELFVGTTKRASITRTAPCMKCDGSGATKPDAEQTCTTCNGRGVQVMTRRLGPGMVQQVQMRCSACNGQGRTLPFEFVCKTCRGGGVQQETKLLDVQVPAGSQAGQRLVLSGEGDCLPGQEPGDIIFVLDVEEHAKFVRRGDHLFSRASVTLAQALSGCAIKLEHLDGRSLLLRSKSKEIIKPGCWRKVAQEGMPVFNQEARGDLFIQLQVIFPETLDDDAARQLAEALAPQREEQREERSQAMGMRWLTRRAVERLRALLPWTSPAKPVQNDFKAAQEFHSPQDLGSVTQYFMERADELEGIDATSLFDSRGGIPRSRL